MPLKLIVDKLDDVAEAQRPLYAEKDGKFHLQVDDLPDVTGLKNTVAATRQERDALQTQIREWAKLGKKPDEVEAMLELERKKAEDAAIKAGKFDEVLAQHLANAKKERDDAVTKAEKQRESALGIARKAIVDTRVGGELVKAKATAEGLDLLTERLGKRVKLEFGDDGKESISILDAAGAPMIGSGSGGVANFTDLVAEAVKGYPSLFQGVGGGGTGSDTRQRQNVGGKTITRAEFDKLGAFERPAKLKEGFKVVD